MSKRRVRSIFISDTHLGCRYTKADLLLQFLKEYQPEHLYLVGDIIDGWRLKRSLHWNDTYNYILRRIIGMTKKHGTKVKYAVGNHDEFLIYFCPIDLGNIDIDREFVHECADGRKMLVIHGDYFDQLTKHLRWTYHLGDVLYEFVLWISEIIQTIRRKFGYHGRSLSQIVKQNVKQAVNFINSFEVFVTKYTKQKECDGVVCGHIHTPVIKQIDGIDYHNCGDWIENCTAIIEYEDGSMELMDYSALNH